MNSKYHTLIIGLFLLLFLPACGQLSVSIETQVPPVLSAEATSTSQPTDEEIAPTNTPTPEGAPEGDQNGTQYWTVVEDPVHGFRFAIPCFWRVEFPQDYSAGMNISYQIYNYPEDYHLSFPRGQGVFESGGVKLDFGIHPLASEGLPAGTSLESFATSSMFNNEMSEITSVEPVSFNTLDAVLVTQQNKETDSSGQFYLVSISDEVVLLVGVAPAEALSRPDVQGILNSLTVDPQASVNVPTHIPAEPPVGVPAACIPEYAEAVVPTQVLSAENTTCGPQSFKSLDYLVQTVQQYLQDRNTGGLRWENFIPDSFMLGYWQSEGTILSPDEFVTMMANSLYRADQPGGMTFTNDRANFPSMDGINPETLIDPQLSLAQIVFSTGWGQDGLGEALLFFVQDECGGYTWHGLLFAGEGFEPSPPPAITIPDDLDCMMVTDAAPLEWVVCNVRDSLRSGNLAALPSFMVDPFALGYWRSEWTARAPDEVIRELQYDRLPVDKSRLVFTADPAQFPDLDGQPLEGMLGPDVKIARVIYSQGWGQDRAGAALLFFSETSPGEYELAGLLLSNGHFDE